MSTNNTNLYSLSRTKHPEVDGSNAQVFAKPSRELIFELIKAGNLAGLMGVDFNGHIVSLWNPQIHKNLMGEPVKIIGNASNAQGEFSLVELSLDAFKYFTLPMPKTRAPTELVSGTPLTTQLCEDTKWKDHDDGTITVALIPKLLPVFFGMNVPQGSLHDGQVAEELSTLGEAYAFYANAVAAYQSGTTSDDAEMIVQRLKDIEDGLGDFVSVDITTKKKEIGVNGPTISTVHASSTIYQEIADTISKYFRPASSNTLSGLESSKIVIRTAQDIDQEAIASDGLVRLSLFYMGGIITPEGRITNVRLGKLSKSFNAILSQPSKSRGQNVKSLLTTGLQLLKNNNPTDIMGDTSMDIIQDVLCNLLLLGRMQTTPSMTMANESNVVGASSFLPQASLDQKVLNAKKQEDKFLNQSLLALEATLKDTPNTTISNLGNLKGTDSIVKLLVNLIGISNSVVDVKAMTVEGTPPLILQLAQQLVNELCGQDTKSWLQLTSSSNAHFPFNAYAIVDAVYACFGAASDDWTNIQAAKNSNPDLTQLKMAKVIQGVNTMNAFITKMRQLVMLGSTDTDFSRFVPLGMHPSSPPAAQHSTGENKRNEPSSSDTNNESSNKRSRSQGKGKSTNGKMPKSGPVREEQAGEGKSSKNLGWVFVQPGAIEQLVPKSMGNDAPCPYFITQGYECKHSPTDCPHGKHIRTPNTIAEANMLKFAKHLSQTGCGYLNRRSIERYSVNVPEDLNVLGNKDGLNQPKTST